MDINQWDSIWKEIQNDTEGRYTNKQVLEHLQKGVPDDASLRGGWPSKSQKPNIKHLGQRKNSKVGHELAGEKGLELQLLGDRGKIKIHYIENGKESLRLQVCFHNMGLGTARGPSQKIIDCFGVIDVGHKTYATAIEVKVDNENPWYAVIENLIQVQMLNSNLANLQKYFGDPPISLGTFEEAWGIVLAPDRYFSAENKGKALQRTRNLIEYLRDKVRLTLVACDEKPVKFEPDLAEVSVPRDAYWQLRYFEGYWPPKTETLNFSA